jgi:hypothetical protein
MVDPIEVNRRNWVSALRHASDTTGDYMLARFRAGEDALHTATAEDTQTEWRRGLLALFSFN